MYRILHKLLGGDVLLKITSANAAGVGVKLVVGLISSKVIAWYLGPQGMAVLGNLRNFLTGTQQLAILGLGNGLIKFTASLKDQPQALKKILSTAGISTLISSIVLGLVLILGAEYWNHLLFADLYSFSWVFRVLGLALPLYTLNGMATSVLSGLMRYRKVIVIQAIIQLLGLVLTVVFILYYDLAGAALALLLTPALGLFVTLLWARTDWMPRLRTFKPVWDSTAARQLGSFTLMAMFSAICLPWVFIAIRNHIIRVDDLSGAGYWDAMNRLSDYYMLFVSSLLTLYVLPRLAAASNDAEFRQVIFGFWKRILPLFGGGLVLVYLLRTWIIGLVFTNAFEAMESLFIWQLIGDFLRLMAVVIAYELLAKNRLMDFLWTQLLSISIIYASSYLLITHYGFVGASMGHAFSYLCYLILMLVLFRKRLFTTHD
ncbi:O-antigen translocase [Croceiramulus getboli]|nr:O-antigen translocase [Flavobacteriaceae bacterium YJPT1-3]